MNDQDLKKLSQLIKDELKPLHSEIAKVKDEVRETKFNQVGVKMELGRIDKDLARMNSLLEDQGTILNEHTDKINALLVDVKDLQDQTKAIWEVVTVDFEQTQQEVKQIKEHLDLPTSAN